MNKLDELIVKLCPDEVEYKRIGEIFDLKNGYTPSKKNPNFWKDGTIPWFTLNDIRTNGRILNDALQHVAKEAVKGGNLVPKNSIIMSTTATIGEHALIKIDALTNQQITSFSLKPLYIEKVNIMFAFYYFYVYGEWCKKNSNQNGGMSIISLEKLRTFEFPLPPLPVQQEIVRILDNFTGLISELNAELDARRKQYEYYRDKLFSFVDKVPIVKLGEIGTIIRGNGLQKKDLTEDGVGCIHYGQIYTYYGAYTYETKSFVSPELAAKLTKVNTGDIVIATTSENIEDVCKCVAWLGENEIVTGGHTAILKHNQNPKYISYYLQTSSFFQQKCKIAQGTKVIEVSSKKLEQILIPLPPLDVQERIVSILDRFDALCNDKTCGLPAEIVARQKQYEYYRDKLLTFKRKNA